GPPRSFLLLAFGRRDELLRQFRALAEEVALELGHPDLLPVRRHQVEAVLVDEDLRVLEPKAPRLLGDVFENTLPELALKRGLLEAFKITHELDAPDLPRHGRLPSTKGRPSPQRAQPLGRMYFRASMSLRSNSSSSSSPACKPEMMKGPPTSSSQDSTGGTSS